MSVTDGCSDCAEQQALNRRGFLRGLAGTAGAAVATAALGAAAPLRVAYAADPTYSGPVLVMISLRGGFDGLSAVCPVGDPDYALNRPDIAVPTSAAWNINDRLFALHPSLKPLKPLWDSGQMAAVHAVGTPDQTRSHFSATLTVEDAAPGTTIRTGWLDRVLGVAGTGTAFEAVKLGGVTGSGLLAGPAPDLSTDTIDGFNLAGSALFDDDALRDTLRRFHSDPSFTATAPANLTLDTVDAMNVISVNRLAPQNGAVYPAGNDLADSLRDAAVLIRAKAGVQSITIDVGSWDMHSDLGSVNDGQMATKLRDVATALAAFAVDLGPAFGNVNVMTMSEFGRRVRQNASHGLDHGHGNVMFMLGGGLTAAKVFGTWPTLAQGSLDSGDLAGTTDYRDVLGAYLKQRAGLSATQLASVFPGFTLTDQGIFR